MEDKKYCVYKLESPEGKVYIGATSNLRHRWRRNGIGYKGSTRIEHAIEKWGWDNFEKTVIIDGLSEEEAYLLEREKIGRTEFEALFGGDPIPQPDTEGVVVEGI